MQDLVLITPPAVEPLSLADAKFHLRVDSSDDDAYITGLIAAVRSLLESKLRRAFITQEWLLKLDGFPGFSSLYNRIGYPAIPIPNPPFQSVVSFQYVDVSGTLQTLQWQTDYGVNQNLMYGYQLDPGSITQPARVLPPFARPWPPCRMVPSNVLLDFICGYCDAAYVTIDANSLSVIDGATFTAAQSGKPIYIPGAGPAGTTLTAVLTVDGSGNGTIAPAANLAVTNAVAFIGGQIPPEIIAGMKMQLAYQYTFRGDADDARETAKGGMELAPRVWPLIAHYFNTTA